MLCVPFALMSRRPGIGTKFLDDKEKSSYYARNGLFFMYDEQGTPYAIPRFFYNKMFTLEQWQKHTKSVEIANLVAETVMYDSQGTNYYKRLVDSQRDYERLLNWRLRQSKALYNADKRNIIGHYSFLQR